MNKTSENYQALFTGLLHAVPLPVFIIDRTMTIRYYNQPAQQLFQQVEQAKHLQLEQVLPDQAIIQHIRESIQSNTPRASHYDQRKADRAWKVTVTPLAHTQHLLMEGVASMSGARGEQRNIIYTYFCVAIEDMAKVSQLERVQRDFLANISHELRTPLTSVRLLAETLEDAIDTDRDKAQAFVEKIEVEVQYLTGLVSEILELSRIESGQMPMTIEPIEAEQLVHEVMARMLPLAQRHRVLLRTDVQQGKTLVAADSKQVARVLVNLVHNAIKFTPSGGIIVMGTALHPQQHQQSFFVRDTGVGIREEDLPRVFERFYKTDRARSKADFIGPGGGGTGLGLAIARHVVEALGGRISVESKPGQGSTFTFTLPLATRGESQPSITAQARSDTM